MEQVNRNRIAYLVAILVGVGAVVIEYYLQQEYLYSQSMLAKIRFAYEFPIFLFVAILVQMVSKVSPWKWAFFIVFINYISVVYVFGTQIPPLEILLVALSALPCVAAGYIGQKLREKLITTSGVKGNDRGAT